MYHKNWDLKNTLQCDILDTVLNPEPERMLAIGTATLLVLLLRLTREFLVEYVCAETQCSHA